MAPPASNAATVPPISLKGARILVVEDEPFIAFDLMMAIEESGAVAIGPAATVAEALDFIGNDPPDGAILDVNLPDGTVAPVLDALPQVAHRQGGCPAGRRPGTPAADLRDGLCRTARAHSVRGVDVGREAGGSAPDRRHRPRRGGGAGTRGGGAWKGLLQDSGVVRVAYQPGSYWSRVHSATLPQMS